jgi:hypothetical protein
MVGLRNSNNAVTDLPFSLLAHCPEQERPDGWEIGVNGKQPVRIIRESELDALQDEAKRELLGSAEKRDADALFSTIDTGESLMRKGRIQKLIGQLPVYVPPSQIQSDSFRPILQFCGRVNQGIAGSRVVVWWSRHEKKFDIGVHCGAVPMRALYILGFARLGQPGGWTKCPNCGKRFRRGHKKERRFCKPNCRAAFAMRELRQRARKASGNMEHNPNVARKTR